MKKNISIYKNKITAILFAAAFLITGCASKQKFNVVDPAKNQDIYFLVRPEYTNSSNGNVYIELYSKSGDTNHYYTPDLSGYLVRIPR